MDTLPDVKPLAILEALLFVAEEPVPLERIEAVLEERSKAEIAGLITEFQERCRQEDRGLLLIEVAGGYRLVTKPELALSVQKFRGAKPSKLSKAALETLAIIAYRQPITKPEIEAIRGVTIDGVLKTLVERELIRILGRKPEVGRPILYGTSRDFLEYFGFNDLSELPTLKEIETLAPNAMKGEASDESVNEAGTPG
ncbi:MAG: SMC-Scp complex subunit ScpB [Candidatus Methylomirabilis oxyfera]|nr:SMC-Scp complex subunit ScpB [Candidatus Methylomirabilis oxyfera]